LVFDEELHLPEDRHHEREIVKERAILPKERTKKMSGEYKGRKEKRTERSEKERDLEVDDVGFRSAIEEQ
jgi:hypothetical protein